MSEATSPADPAASGSPLFDGVVATKIIRALRKECCGIRLRLRQTEKELERLRGVEIAFHEITDALQRRPRP